MLASGIGLAAACLPAGVVAAAERRFPPPQFETDHQMPVLGFPAEISSWQGAMDVGLLGLFLVVATWLVLKRRTRAALLGLALVSLIYFGFIRQGCVCPIGAIQNVSLSLTDSGYALPWVIGAFFLLPILFTLIAGRVFCAGVCPLGAIQDVVGIRAAQLPAWVDHSFGLLAYAYLGLAVLLVATGSGFVICQYDPFVGIFRMSGEPAMLIFGGGLLVLGLVVVRPYCRFLCPYGVILGCLSPMARHKPRLDPVGCINCHLCKDTCPVNAIQLPTTETAGEQLSREARRGRLLICCLALPLLVGLGAGSGYLASQALAQLNPMVSLAAQVDAGAPDGPAREQLAARRNLGMPEEQLHQQADAVRARFAIGSPILGGFLGLVVASKLILLSVRQGSDEYEIAQSRCVACGRCFEYCPHHPANEARLAELTVEGARP